MERHPRHRNSGPCCALGSRTSPCPKSSTELASIDPSRAQTEIELSERWEHQATYFGSIRAELVAQEGNGSLIRDEWTGGLVGRVQLTFDVEDQYAAQDRWGDGLESKSIEYPGILEADLTAFIDADEGIFEDGELIPPHPVDVISYDF